MLNSIESDSIEPSYAKTATQIYFYNVKSLMSTIKLF
jgi:hypothetical protein